MYKVSIIVPSHNDGEKIKKTIDSCLNQTEKNIEVIVVDNGSESNETWNFLKKYQDTRIKYVFLKKGNRSYARNYGLSIAKGKYIQLLDSDDYLIKDKIERSCEFLDSNKDVFAYMTATEYQNEHQKMLRTVNASVDQLKNKNPIPISSVIFRNYQLAKFDINLKRCEDWMFWVENLSGKKIQLDNEFVGNIIVITGRNSMQQIENMVWYSYIVRSRINFKDKINRFFPGNIKCQLIDVLQILLFDKCVERKKKLFSKTFFVAIVGVMLTQTPVLNNYLKNKLTKIRINNIYRK